MYEEKKFEIAQKLIELEEISSNITLTEQEDIQNILNRGKLIISGRYDSMDYMVQEEQIEQCLNSLNYMLKKFNGRTK